MSETTIKDSGKREEFATGSRRDTREGKGRFDLISPIFEERMAKHLEGGAIKYGDRNWEKGQPLCRYIDSCRRHLNKYLQGHRDEDHMVAAAWNLMAFIHTEEMLRRGVLPETLNDLPTYTKPATPATAPVTPSGCRRVNAPDRWYFHPAWGTYVCSCGCGIVKSDG